MQIITSKTKLCSFCILCTLFISSCAIQKNDVPIEYHHNTTPPPKREDEVVPVIDSTGDVLFGLSQETSESKTVEEKSNESEVIVPQDKSSNEQEGKIIYHEVQIGETIADIAENYGLSVESIVQMNGLNKPYHVEESDILKIKLPLIQPKPKEYVAESKFSQPTTPLKSVGAEFIKPIGGKIISKFGQNTVYGINKGVNIEAEPGMAIKASASGRVIYSSYDATFGNLVIIKLHDKNIVTAYAHMEDAMLKVGEVVEQGDVVGHVGVSGKVESPQLHFAIREGKVAKDPLLYLLNND